MTISEMIPNLLKGEKVRRKSWASFYWLSYNEETFTVSENVFFGGEVHVTHKDNINDRIFTIDDITASDWEIVNETKND